LIHDNPLNVTAENNVGRKLVNTVLPLKPLLVTLLPAESYTIIPFSVYDGNITDTIPPVVRVPPPLTYSFANSNYTLHAAVIGVSIGENTNAMHAIAAFVCNDTQYVYDANLHSIVQADWRVGRLEPYFHTVKTNATISKKYNTVSKFETLVYVKSDKETPAVAMQPQQPTVAMQPQQPVVAMQPKQPTVAMQPQQPTVVMQPQQPTVVMQPQQPQQPQQPRVPNTVSPK
jgi:hypothetical protein